MKFFTILCLIFTIACTRAGTPSVNVTVPVSSAFGSKTSETSEVEVKEEEEEPQLEALQDYPAVPLTKGSVSPEDGVLLSPRHVAQAALDATAATRLSIENRVLVDTHRKEMALTDSYIKKQESDLEICRKKSWWDKNGNVTMLGIGVATGILTSLAVFKISVRVANSE